MTDTLPPESEVKPLVWTPHPLLPIPSEAQQAALLAGPEGVEELSAYYAQREKLIALAEQDPFTYGFEPPHWKDADALRELQILFVIIFGGNRAGKSEYAAKRVVQDAMAHPESVIFCFHENEKASIGLQQKYIWRYLPLQIKRLEGKQHPIYKIKYSQANGFTDGKIVLPNRTEIYFLTYHQKPGDFEGLELGAKQTQGRLGGWADENMPLRWFQMLQARLASRSAKLLWTFTPKRGITPVIKEVLGSTSKTLQSRFAELLPDRVNVTGLPVGHMPYTVEPYMKTARVIYFHSILNPFGAHYKNIKALCDGKPSEQVERIAYGYARDVGERAFVNFGAWNVVEPEQLPAVGTNYMFIDPAGARNWATLWVRATPGNPARLYIYRDWPPAQVYGEWAVQTEKETSADTRKGWDGDPGPAQNSLGYGIVKYKNLWLKCESITARTGHVQERDPYRARLVAEWQADLAEAGGGVTETATLQEEIQERYIDSRAGRNQTIADKGGTCLIDELGREQRKDGGAVLAPAMRFRKASGVDTDEGIQAVQELLDWNADEALMPLVNEPLLYVSSECRQVIWAMQNYTGFGGETGACKDFIDLVRYLALARLRYISPGMNKVLAGGSY